jgi:sulfide:quinone oxidoreductase
VYIHKLSKDVVERNYYHGWSHVAGDFICYSPKFPYKGEGSDFYALIYEHYMRQDRMDGRVAANARIQYWTPNKEIFEFPYANEVALEECAKRGIDVMFGWEMTEVKYGSVGEKIAIFKNVDSGEVIEKDFMSACINPPSKPHSFLADAGLLDSKGGVDVNQYTLQHKVHENIFAMGDCIGGNTTRTQVAAMGQAPIIKNNLLEFMHGRDVNGIWDGYSWMPFYMGHTYAAGFSHNHDFEPAAMNHATPSHGIFSKFYYKKVILNDNQGAAKKYNNKDHGPPHYRYSAEMDALEHNEVLQAKGIAPEEVRHPAAQARMAEVETA